MVDSCCGDEGVPSPLYGTGHRGRCGDQPERRSTGRTSMAADGLMKAFPLRQFDDHVPKAERG